MGDTRYVPSLPDLTPTQTLSGDFTTTRTPSQSYDTSFHHVAGTIDTTARQGANAIAYDAPANSGTHMITTREGTDLRIKGGNGVLLRAFDTEDGEPDDIAILNRADIDVDWRGIALKAVSNGAHNIRIVNYGDITLTGPEAPPTGRTPNLRLITASIHKGKGPRDFDFTDGEDGATRFLDLVNMPEGKLIATGDHNGRIDGLKFETGSGHLGRIINYGEIDLQGPDSRALSAQTLWGESEAHNLGRIEVDGAGTAGIHAGTCAPWAQTGGCHQGLDDHVINPVYLAPGDAYGHNYQGASITMTGGRDSIGMRTRAQQGGRGYAINEGSIVTGGEGSHGIHAISYTDLLDNIHLAPDTRNHDFVYVDNSNTGTIETSGDNAHGIFAAHYRGSRVVAGNSGRISVSGDDATGLFAASYGGKIIVEDQDPSCRLFKGYDSDRNVILYPVEECRRVYEERIESYPEEAKVEGMCQRDLGSPASLCERIYDGGRVVAVNHGDIVASGEGGVGLRAESRVCDRAGERPHATDPCRHEAGTHRGGAVEVFNSGNITVTGADGTGIDARSDGGPSPSAARAISSSAARTGWASAPKRPPTGPSK